MKTATSLFLALLSSATLVTEAAESESNLDSLYLTAVQLDKAKAAQQKSESKFNKENKYAIELGIRAIAHADVMKDRLANQSKYINEAKKKVLEFRTSGIKEVVASISTVLKSEDCIQSGCQDLVRLLEEKKDELAGFETQINQINSQLGESK